MSASIAIKANNNKVLDLVNSLKLNELNLLKLQKLQNLSKF